MATQKDYYGSRAFDEGDDKHAGKSSKADKKDDDYVRNYSIANNLSEELGKGRITKENKYRNLESQAVDLSAQDLVNLRIRQLSVIKILVKIHGRDKELLVKAHADLGHAYHNFKCPDQAYEHLVMAYERNQNFVDTEQGQEYQLYILKLLSINRLQDGRPDEAINFIQEAENICLAKQNEGLHNANRDLAEVKRHHGEYLTAKKMYQDALECYGEVNSA